MSKSRVLNSLRNSDAEFLEAQLNLCMSDLQSLLLSKSSSGQTIECADRLLKDLRRNHKSMSQAMRAFIEGSATSLADKFVQLDALESHATAALLQYLLLVQDARQVLRAERPKPCPVPDRPSSICPACKLDTEGSTWCSAQKPGCPMPASPPIDTNPPSDLPPAAFDFYDEMAKKAGIDRETAKRACFSAAYGSKSCRDTLRREIHNAAFTTPPPRKCGKSALLDALKEIEAALNSPSTPVKVRVVFVPHEQ